MRKAIAIAALVFAVSAGRAAADPIADVTPSHNDVIGVLEGWSGANLYLSGGPSTISIQFLGYEAGWTNTFSFGDNVLFTTGGPNPGVVIPNVAPGLLNFAFSTISPSGNPPAVNGSNLLPLTELPNFFLSFNEIGTLPGTSNPQSGQFAILAFDDGGAGPDDNHDDLVVRLTIVGGNGTFTVPEGGSTLTLALVGLGMIGLASMRRKYAL